MGEDEHQSRRVLTVFDVERSDLPNSHAIHCRNRDVADEVPERTLLRARKEMIAAKLDELSRGGRLVALLQLGRRRSSGNSGCRQEFTSVHEYLVDGVG